MQIEEILQQLGTQLPLPARSELQLRRSGEPLVYYLLNGCLTLREQAEDRVVDLFWPGDLIGRPAGSARASIETVLLEIPESHFVAALKEHRELAAWAWEQHQQRIAGLGRRVRLLSWCSVEQRILNTVLELNERAAASTHSRTIPLAQRELADLAGATREGTSTILNRLHRQGLVSLGRRCIKVEAPQQLRAILNELSAGPTVPQLALASA